MKRAMSLACLAAVLAATQSGGGAQAQPAARTTGLDDPRWAVFSDRYGTRVDYPAGIFTIEEGQVPRGDGRSFRSADGRARLLVYVEPNREHLTPSRFMRTLFTASRSETDYKRVAPHFFAVSGIRETHIYYSRCNFPDGAAGRLHCIYLDYPKAEEKRWDAIVTRISLSLRPLR